MANDTFLDDSTPAPASADPTPAPAAADSTPAADAAPLDDDQRPNILTRIVRAIDRALEAGKRAPHEQACYIILDTTGGQRLILDPSEKAKLIDWQKQHDALIQFIQKTTRKDSHLAFELHQKAVAKSIHAGTTIEAKSVEAFEKDFEAKMEAAKLDLKRIYKECHPLAVDIGYRFNALAVKRVNDLEASERYKYENYGLPYSPSPLIQHLRKSVTIANARLNFNEFGNASPKQLLPYLNF